MSDPFEAEDLATEFRRLNEYLESGAERVAALQHLVDVATTSVPGCDWAGVTQWPQNARPRTIAQSDEVALTADQIQYALGDGPCLSAAADDEWEHVIDLNNDGRWPQFRVAVRRRTPIRSMLSFQIGRMPDRVALNLYSGRPAAFDTAAVATAALFATHARVLLTHAGSFDRATQLGHALIANRQISTAVGILMDTHNIPSDAAFGLLRVTSQQLHRKLHLIADEVNRTGALPDTAP